jgi:hypothetical protein
LVQLPLYLLLRTSFGADASNGDFDNGQNITSEDVDEFNPSYGSNRRTGNTRISMSSYNSRTTNNTSPRRNLQPLYPPTPLPHPQRSPLPITECKSTKRLKDQYHDSAKSSSLALLSRILLISTQSTKPSRSGYHL